MILIKRINLKFFPLSQINHGQQDLQVSKLSNIIKQFMILILNFFASFIGPPGELKTKVIKRELKCADIF